MNYKILAIMEQSIKDNIKEALKVYRKDNDLSQDAIASKAGVNVSWINLIELGKTHNGNTAIKDLYYKKIADAINLQYEKVFWKHVDTPQYLQLYSEMASAKVSGQVRTLVGETSHGKTYTVNCFVKKAPKNTYRITVSSLYRLPDIIDELCDLLNVPCVGSKVSKMKKISKSLNDIRLRGGKPCVIIDEAENMTVPVIGAFKALYDAIEKNCSIVFACTPEFIYKLQILRDNPKKSQGIRQFYSRIEAGIRWIKEIDKENDFEPFLELIEDLGVREMLLHMTDNYRVLNHRVEYALQEANRMGVPLTEKLFKSLFNL